MVIDLQRKYRYSVSFAFNSDPEGTASQVVAVDEFVPPEARREPVTKQNRKLGQITIVGPPTYGEMTLRFALRINEATVSDLLTNLFDLEKSDVHTCDVTLSTQTLVNAAEQNSYSQTYTNCNITGVKLDTFNRKTDDDFVHCEVTLIPSVIGNLIKEGD